MSAPLQNLVVMFADINGSVTLYEKHGNELAQRLVGECLRRLKDVTDQSGGRVVRSTGDGVLAVFAEADAALTAAAAMNKVVAEIETPPGVDLGIHVGCHYGEMMEVAGDLYGDSVNLTARIASLAQPGQVKTTEETVARLSPALKAQVRCIGPLAVKGKREPEMIYEFLYEEEKELTLLRSNFEFGGAKKLVLKNGDAEYVLSSHSARPLVFGRSPDCDILVPLQHASRRHGRIEVRGSTFFVVDHSANGTHIIPASGEEIVLRHQDLSLQGKGLISAGCSPTLGLGRHIQYEVQRSA